MSSTWERAGFFRARASAVFARPVFANQLRSRHVDGASVPYWFAATYFGLLPAVQLLLFGKRQWKAARRTWEGRCALCGYDLRATPGRCPECGTIAAAELAG